MDVEMRRPESHDNDLVLVLRQKMEPALSITGTDFQMTNALAAFIVRAARLQGQACACGRQRATPTELAQTGQSMSAILRILASQIRQASLRWLCTCVPLPLGRLTGASCPRASTLFSPGVPG
jgi:hypothetical protein